jgi:hypothetical protein
MKIDLLGNVGRELSRWRDSLRSRGRPTSTPARVRPHRADEDDTEWSTTEWATTEWAETSPDTVALSGPIDSDSLDARA